VRAAKTTAGIQRYPAMGSSGHQVGRLQGGSWGNKGNGDVVALAAVVLLWIFGGAVLISTSSTN
jgi:hypothetical protein